MMKKKSKLILLYSVFFCSFSLSAQTELKKYIEIEAERIEKVKAIEIEIEAFISEKINSYRLDQSVINQAKKNHKMDSPDSDFNQTLYSIKRSKLRKLFFQEHSELKNMYIANLPQETLSQLCINGDFENDVLANYNFFSEQLATNLECGVSTPQVSVSPVINQFSVTSTNLVSIIDSSDTATWDPVTMQFDPALNRPLYGSIQVPTLSPNGGSRCIKLNNSSGGGTSARNVTTVSRQILIDDPLFEYELSLMLQASGHLINHEEPVFTVKFYDLNRNLMQQRCIISKPNCIFKEAFRGVPIVGHSDNILYTGWICDAIDVSALMDNNVIGGVNAIVEFTVTDCGQGGHFGTVYLDNICGFTCENPAFGMISVRPDQSDCPDLINDVPYRVCGNYVLPVNSVLSSITISVSMNHGVSFIPIDPLNAPVTIDSVNRTFCIDIDNSVFTTNADDNYVFQVSENYKQTCNGLEYQNANTAITVVDLTQCCFPTLTLTSPNGDMGNNSLNSISLKERSEWIKASNKILSGNNDYQDGVVFHAGEFVEMTPGFETVFGAQFAAYVAGCTNNFEYKSNANIEHNENQQTRSLEKYFVIYPNPSNDNVEIIMKDITFSRVMISAVDGKVVLDKRVDRTSNYKLDISRYANGIYIVNLIADDGKQYSQKLIKN